MPLLSPAPANAGPSFCRTGKVRSTAALAEDFRGLLLRDALVQDVVAHQHRRGAATRQTFDELDGNMAILAGLRAVGVRVQTQLVT